MTPLFLEEITAICLIRANRLPEAARVLASCTADFDGRRSYLLGVVYAKQGDDEKAVQEFQKIPVSSPYRTMARQFLEGGETPYPLLKSGRREEAARIWEEALQRNPDDLVIWHNLAVLSYWHAKHLEEMGELAEAKSKWQKAIGYWAGVLASDQFWREWAVKRATACDVQEPNLTQIVDVGFMKYFLSDLQDMVRVLEPDRVKPYLRDVANVRAGVEKQFPTHFVEEKARALERDTAEMYGNLLVDWSHEWSVARLWERAKKIHRIVEHTNQNDLHPATDTNISKTLEPIEGDEIDILLNTIEQDLDINRRSSIGVPSCGPMMLEFLNRTADAQHFVTTALAAIPTNATIAQLKQANAPSFTRLQFYLSSDLGRWLAMIDMGLFGQAIEGIREKLQRERPQEPIARNLRVLLAMACHDKAKSMSMPSDPENAAQNYAASVEALEVAHRLAYDAMTAPAPFDFKIPRLIEEICTNIPQSVDNNEITPQEGIHLLQRLYHIAPPGRDAICQRALNALTY